MAVEEVLFSDCTEIEAASPTVFWATGGLTTTRGKEQHDIRTTDGDKWEGGVYYHYLQQQEYKINAHKQQNSNSSSVALTQVQGLAIKRGFTWSAAEWESKTTCCKLL